MDPISTSAAAAGVAGKALQKAASDNPKTDAVLLDQAQTSGALDLAAEVRARREAVKQQVRLKLWQPVGRMVGISKDFFEFELEDAIADKLTDVPDEDLVTPKGSVAGPALSGIGLTVEEPELREMYLNLLAAASDRRIESKAHPSFAQVIAQINSEEAHLLGEVLVFESLPLLEVRQTLDDGFLVIQSNLLAWPTGSGVWQVLSVAHMSLIDNWIRLGLVRIGYDTYLISDEQYSWRDNHPIVKAANESFGSEKIHCEKGKLVVTDFGRQFYKVVIARSYSEESAIEPSKNGEEIVEHEPTGR
ncbi:DUF4393 domain-containing protein [Gordonia otitidis]|uniref:DUF4393 domain-containing protein n=1 Tax=Gordonia otitidis TaxID=249058 RepID=UPI001D14A90C|nr:DUF4393 domain-containing protein [Gordonia otitidis]UEA61352.1 DUF4393 domain-containing protein [Gordonia otitidis]